MTLNRQLLLIILTLFSCMLVGTFTISLNNTRQYLMRQLESHAQDAATSLGLSLSPHMSDPATMNAMVDAIFDRGYYQEIAIDSVDGKQLIKRINPVQIKGVPDWFIAIIPLETPHADALIVDGWIESGRVRISSHPGLAYDELWRTAVDTFYWYFAAALFYLFLSLSLLRIVLKPLRAVEEQAEAICNRSYPVQHEIPRSRELRKMVLAMNKMSLRVKQMFEEQSAITDALRDQAHLDPVTGIGNRRYFDKQMEYLTQNQEEFIGGALILLRMCDFKNFNDVYGYNEGDNLLRRIAEMIRSVCQDKGECIIARLGGAEFAIIMPYDSPEAVGALAQNLSNQLFQLSEAWAANGNGHPGYIGAALFTGQSAAELLSHADQALRTAQDEGKEGWSVYRYKPWSEGFPDDINDWRKYLEVAIDNNLYILHFQPVYGVLSNSTEVIFREIFLRLKGNSGNLLVAGLFMPMAEKIGLARDLDMLVVKAALHHMSQEAHGEKTYAINITTSSMRDAKFVNWLCEQLILLPQCAIRLIFEIPEYGILHDVHAAKLFAQRLHGHGSKLSIDQFGRNFASFAYLNSINPTYIKLDGSFVRNINLDKDNQFLVQALTRTAHEINVKVIALNVESNDEQAILTAMRVDGVQGYLIGRPESE